MQNHPPDKNNPSNPLIKVAALTLDKEYETLSPNSQVRVLATLNFKRSDDLRGRAETKSGEEITVTFSLALKRASLELNASFEDAPGLPVNIQRVAHLAALYVHDRIANQISTEDQLKTNLAVGLDASLGASVSGVHASAKGLAKAGFGKNKKVLTKRKTARALSRGNVAVTFGGNSVHWEISPNMLSEKIGPNETDSWIEGELFKAKNARQMDACTVAWKHDEEKGTPIINGSVFVTMADLIIENIRVMNDMGDEVSLSQIDQAAVSRLSRLNPFGVTETKERFVRQVIRKHLVAQGMRTEGARVEICRAFT